MKNMPRRIARLCFLLSMSLGITTTARGQGAEPESIVSHRLAGTAAFPATGSMTIARSSHTATLLPSGKVLVAGGNKDIYSDNPLASAELYDPVTGNWSTTGSLTKARSSHTATLLSTGKVLVVGGFAGFNDYLASAELYDPLTGSWSTTGSLAVGRGFHTATLLASDKVLVVGGYAGFNNYLASAEIYDPVTGTWSSSGNLTEARDSHTATLLRSGKVLVAGGYGPTGAIGNLSLASAELYDPATDTWSTTGSLITAAGDRQAILLPSGKVLVTGGYGVGPLADAELYDPATGSWSKTASLKTARSGHTATLLVSGKVLVAGGTLPTTSAELYDPATGTWSTSGNLTEPRLEHTATLLLNDKVLLAGGLNDSGTLASAELYDPASTAALPAQLSNISTRLQVLGGENVLIGGFIATGSEAKKVLIRAVGPSLAEGGIEGFLPDPVLELHGSDGAFIASNDDWKDTDEAAIQATGFAPSSELESAILTTLDPNKSYTAIISAKGTATGIALVEAYDMDQAADATLANISTRGFVQSGDNVMIGGFILGGASGPSEVIVRAIGPSLEQLGITNPLADPTLELHDGSGALIRSNDDWKVGFQTDVEATGLAPTNEKESAIVATLAAGQYTAIVAGKDGGTGVGLVEVYNLK